MSESSRRIDAILALGLAPALKAAGYRRSARTWRRTGSASIRVINAQGSSWNDAGEGKFTLNLGLYFPLLVPFFGWGEVTANPTEPLCQVRVRIGELLPGGEDHWWSVSPSSDIPALGSAIREAWERYAAPWLEAHDDLAAARPLIARQHAWGSAVVSLALGERAEAQRLVGELLAGPSKPVLADALRRWARQHELEF